MKSKRGAKKLLELHGKVLKRTAEENDRYSTVIAICITLAKDLHQDYEQKKRKKRQQITLKPRRVLIVTIVTRILKDLETDLGHSKR